MWATVDDIKARWLTGSVPATDAQIGTLIDDAEDIVTREFNTIQTAIDAGDVPLNRVVRVVSRMVIRVLRNPEGLRQVQETTGPTSGTQTYGGDHPGELYLTDDDRKDLSAQKVQRRAFTISTIPGGYR